MLSDKSFLAGLNKYLASRIRLARSEKLRCLHNPESRLVADYYLRFYQDIEKALNDWEWNLSGQWQMLASRGSVEIIATAQTHVLLPFILDEPAHLRLQIACGIESVRRHIGVTPKGFWLPECGWDARVEPYLVEAGIEWIVVESKTPEADGIVETAPSGLVRFYRHQKSARMIWDNTSGYPTSLHYRDFYRDIGFDCDPAYIAEYLPGRKFPGFSGIKPLAISGVGYRPEEAKHQVERDVSGFTTSVAGWATNRRYNIMPFDTELFGHWWHEGPSFIENLILRSDQIGLDLWMLPCDYLSNSGGMLEFVKPGEKSPASSWGDHRDFSYWLNEKNIHESSRIALVRKKFWAALSHLRSEVVALSDGQVDSIETGLKALMLMESSDWIFMISGGKTAGYGRDRIDEYGELVGNFSRWMESGGKCGIADPDDPVIIQMASFHVPFPAGWLKSVPVNRD